MRKHTELTLAVWLSAAIVAVLLALVPMAGQAAEQLTPEQAVAKWDKLNDDCRGQPTLGMTDKVNPTCPQRDAIMRALMKKGYVLENHDVWVAPQQVDLFVSVLVTADAQARSNGVSSFDSIMVAMPQALRTKIPDAQLFAMWNDPDFRRSAQQRAPYGWAFMSEIMERLARLHSKSNDPRFSLDY